MDEDMADEVGGTSASVEGDTAEGPSQIPEESSKVSDQEEKVWDLSPNEASPATDDAAADVPATDDAAPDVASPEKRKSHRPSLEVVEVKVDSFYDKAAFKQELQHGELARNNIAPHHSFGLDTARPDNLKYIEPGKVMYAAGNTLAILEVATMKRRVVFGLDGGGVGCFAVHPSGTLLAVGDKGSMPNIYVYEYPSFKIAKVLRKGTERGYRAMDFTTTGEKLASVGQAPDFMLTVWDWVNEKVILHCKAFGQDVAKVSFSPDDEGRLTTSGTGHIRFWRVAGTFTGLKLQGDIGKFGKIEMTDIDCFCHMPDGKVVSGAESGSLLVWEGQFIKCRVVRPGAEGCHDGPILHVSLDRTDMLVVTAGADGYIRWWPFADIDGADTEDDSMRCEVVPAHELYIDDGVTARCVERGGIRGDPGSDHLLITDGAGALWRVPFPDFESVAALEGTPAPGASKLATFHAGAITGVDTSFLEQLAATCGVDGTVRIWDFLTKKPLEIARFPRPAQCLQWANDHVDPAGHTVAVGFSDGVVRVLVRDPRGDAARGEAATGVDGSGAGGISDDVVEGSLRRAQTLKPHDAGVACLAYSPNGKLLATVGKDCKLFFIKSYLTAEMQDYQPVGFYTLPSTPTSVCWSRDSSSVIVTCIGGQVAEVDLSGGHLDGVDSSQSFEIPDIPVRWYTFKRRPLQPTSILDVEMLGGAGGEQAADDEEAGVDEEGGEEEVVEEMAEELRPPPPALKAAYAQGGGERFLLAMGGWARGAVFECAWEEEFPTRDFPAGYGPASTAAIGAKPPTITTLRYTGPTATGATSSRASRDKNGPGEDDASLLLCGCDDGGVTVRPALAAGVYARVQAHDGDASVAAAACSCDGEWIVSGDSDGILAVHRLRRGPFAASALDLSEQMRHVGIPSALSPASSPMGSRSKKRGKSPTREPPPAPRAVEPPELPAFLSEYMDDGQGAVAELDGFERVHAIPQGFGSEAPLIEEEATDITDEAAYSIQEDKLKTEDDNRRMAAEAKKEGVRAMIRQMQAEFARLVEENASAPPGERLTESDMLIDPGYDEMLEQQGRELCEEVTRELEYSKQESELHLAKLRRRFTENVEMECITLRALQWDYEVSSFRVEKPSVGLRKLLDAVHEQIRNEERENMAAKTEMSGEAMSEAGMTSFGAVNTQGALSVADTNGVSGCGAGSSGAGLGTIGDSGIRVEGKVSTFEARKAKRHARQVALAKLLKEKPAEDADDPRDVEAIARANASMGDYKLKSSPEYEVPEEMQLNVLKKQREMVLLEDSLHTMRSRFNSRFLALRTIKREILSTVAADNRRLREIDTELGEGGNGGDLWEPALDPSEWPEMRDYVSPEELTSYANLCRSAAEADATRGGKAIGDVTLPPAPPRVTLSLDDLAAAEEAKVALQVQQDRGPRDTSPFAVSTAAGEGSAAVIPSDPNALAVTSSSSEGVEAEARGVSSVEAMVSMIKDVEGMINRLPAARRSKAPTDGEMSALEEEEREARDMLLRHEKRTILEAAAENVLAFDEAIYDLRRERMLTAAHLKAAELKLLVLRQELEMLNQFDTKDRALSTKMDKQQHDKKEVVTAIAACKAKLSAAQAEAEAGAVLEAKVLSEFLALVPEASQFHEVLNKIFRKKIKRAKKRLSGEDEEGDDESEEEDSDEDDYDFDDDDEEEVDDSCPPGCDVGLYEKVLELRESRLDHEETLGEVQKATDEHKRNLDRQITRQRQIDKDLKQTATEIKAAQADKQTELNKLDVVVSLKLNQLYCMDNAVEGQCTEGGEDGDKPRRRGSVSRPKLVADAGMDTHILFTRVGLDRLKRRISELVQENKEEKNNFKARLELHRERGRLEKARVVKEAEMEEHQARCNEIQVLKFGQLIDLEMVDKVSSGMSQEEARRRVEAIEDKHATELARLEERNRELRGRLLESTYENTKQLREVADLSSRQFSLEKELNTSGGSAALGSRGPTLRKEAEERDRLAALVKLQARELDAIKAEINLLRRKGGHIYAPVPLPPIQQHHEQQFHPAPPSDIQLGGGFANQPQDVPSAMIEDAREGAAIPQDEALDHEQQSLQRQQPETFVEEQSVGAGAGY
ncbi:unnamed protein product [Scytosiphon promiscuus]